MIFGVEVNEASACAHFAAHDRLKAPRLETRQVGIVVFGPVGDMLQSGMPRLEEVSIHRWRLVADLDQLHLQRTGIGERNRIVRLVSLTAIAVVLDGHAGIIEPWSDAEFAAPMVHGLFDVVDDITRLSNLAK